MTDQVDFVIAAPPVPLKEKEIQLWLYRITEREDKNAASERFDSAWRTLLACYCGRKLEQPTLIWGAHGKPALASRELEFNVSHSDDALVIGLSRDIELGIDIEFLPKERSTLALAKRFFTEREWRSLIALPRDQQTLAFLRLWTAKEAVLKAIGRGLAFGLDRVEFSVNSKLMPELSYVADEAQSAKDWQIRSFLFEKHWCGALAWRGADVRLND